MKRCGDANDGSKGSGVEEAAFGHSSIKQMRSPRRSIGLSDIVVNGGVTTRLLDAEVNWGL